MFWNGDFDTDWCVYFYYIYFRVYRYLLVCVNNSLQSRGVRGCKLSELHSWLLKEVATFNGRNEYMKTCIGT